MTKSTSLPGIPDGLSTVETNLLTAHYRDAELSLDALNAIPGAGPHLRNVLSYLEEQHRFEQRALMQKVSELSDELGLCQVTGTVALAGAEKLGENLDTCAEQTGESSDFVASP